MESTKEIALYINNNAVELVQEIPALTYRKRFIFQLVYDKYQLIMVKEPWEYTLFPRYCGEKLELLYKNIIIRLHHFSTYRGQGFNIHSWYNIMYTNCDAIALYKKSIEDVEIKSQAVEYFFFTPKDGITNEYSIKEKKRKNNYSLALASYELVVSAAPIDLLTLDYYDNYLKKKKGAILEYEKKTEKDIERYIENSEKKIPEQELYNPKEDDYLKMTQGFDIEMLKKYIQQNPDKQEELSCVYPERKENEKQEIQKYEKDGSYILDNIIEEKIAELKLEESDWESESDDETNNSKNVQLKISENLKGGNRFRDKVKEMRLDPEIHNPQGVDYLFHMFPSHTEISDLKEFKKADGKPTFVQKIDSEFNNKVLNDIEKNKK